jgi:PAB-dependent poly(A)-specific ribonuclease subunit 2
MYDPNYNPYANGPIYYNSDDGLFELQTLTEPGMQPEPITAATFDPFEEVLWTGTGSGRIVGYVAPTMDKYASWTAHEEFGEVRQMLVDEYGILSISSNTLRVSDRGGMRKFFYSHQDLEDIQCMAFVNSTNSHLIVGGISDSMFVFDLERGQVIKEVQVSAGVTAVKKARLLCCGSTDGKITLRDPRSYRIEHSFEAHSAGVNDMDLKGDLLVSCGFSSRMGQSYLDSYIKVFDLRMMRILRPLNFPPGALLLKFHPKFSSTLIIVSQAGQFQLCDAQGDLSSLQNYQMDTQGQYLMSFDICSSGEVLALGDTGGCIHLWGDNENFKVNMYSRNSLEMDLMLEGNPAPPYKMNEWSSLNVGMHQPHLMHPQGEPMFSDWSGGMMNVAMYPHMTRPQEPLDHMRRDEYGNVLPNTGRLRNQVRRPMPYQSNMERNNYNHEPNEQRTEHAPFNGRARPPKSYRRIPIKFTKLGVEDFDFSAYNKTNFSGLENVLPNSFCNALMQTLYFIPQFRISMLNHLCNVDHCLSCELGFLFHMFDIAHGNSCQASNFWRAMRENPAAARLELLEDNKDVSKSIRRFNSFLFQQIHKELLATKNSSIPVRTNNTNTNTTPAPAPSPAPPTTPSLTVNNTTSNSSNQRRLSVTTPNSSSIVDQLFGSTLRSNTHCLTCQHESTRDSKIHQHTLNISAQSTDSNQSFAAILRNTLQSSTRTRAWCEHCRAMQLCDQQREVVSLPHVMCLQLPMSEPANDLSAFWQSLSSETMFTEDNTHANHWLPFRIAITKDSKSGKLVVQEYSESTTKSSDVPDLYELTAVISCVTDVVGENTTEHVIAQIKVPHLYHDLVHHTPTHSSFNWYMFNDFYIQPTSKYETVYINSNWKIPCLVYYSRVDLEERLPPVPFVNPINEHVLFAPNALSAIRTTPLNPTTVVPLKLDEVMPALTNDYVAIDTEFVLIGDEEVVERPDGGKMITKPGLFSLARVSVLRGSGAQEGVPFIDEYIATDEKIIKDYLTQFSGIFPGDLEPTKSPHNVVTLKQAYLKLRYLVDRGCKFVGHGLKKDFRTINLIVPKDQLIDTVELFHLKRQRKISLKFLASFLLGLEIQTKTHDSIEDANTALMLYHRYIELVREDAFDDVLNDIYSVGRSKQWRYEALGSPAVKTSSPLPSPKGTPTRTKRDHSGANSLNNSANNVPPENLNNINNNSDNTNVLNTSVNNSVSNENKNL